MKNNIFIKICRLLYLTPLCLLAFFTDIKCQENKSGNLSIKTGIGLGFNSGKREEGFGLVYNFGIQQSYGKQNRLRLNPNLMIGGFSNASLTDNKDNFYRITNLSLNANYDILKAKPFSLFLGGGGFVNYSRGLIGTGGDNVFLNQQSEFFYTIYYGLNTTIGLRAEDEKRNIAYEVKPISLYLGNKKFALGYLMFSVDFKLRKH
jgi:opacity protein-like surface antigen